MGRKYKNPPIQEAVCEFRFLTKEEWDLTVPGLFYEKIRSVFPLKERQIDHILNITPLSRGPTYSHDVVEKAVFLSEDRRIFIWLNLKEKILSVHHLKPYTSWETFREKIKLAFDGLQSLEIDTNRLIRIGLRYINRIEVPSTHEIKKFFNLKPVVDEVSFEEFAAFFIGVDVKFDNGRNICRIQFMTTSPQNPTNDAFILDLDYFNNPRFAIESDRAFKWIEDAHSRIEVIFEKCITDELRKLFQGG